MGSKVRCVLPSLSPLSSGSGVTSGSLRLQPHLLGHRSRSQQQPAQATHIKQQMTEILNIGVCIQAGKINNTISLVAEQTFAHLLLKTIASKDKKYRKENEE